MSFLTQFRNGAPNRLGRKRATVTICGTEDRTWLAYAFLDTVPDHDVQDRANGAGAQDVPYDHDEEVYVDPVTAVLRPYDEQPTECREYFVQALLAQATKVSEEWLRVVYHLESSFKMPNEQAVSSPGANTASGTEIVPGQDHSLLWTFQQEIDLVKQMVSLLGRLQVQLDATIASWDEFEKSGGDMDYFVDEEFLECATLYIPQIKQAFEALRQVRLRLTALDGDCKRRIKIVSPVSSRHR